MPTSPNPTATGSGSGSGSGSGKSKYRSDLGHSEHPTPPPSRPRSRNAVVFSSEDDLGSSLSPSRAPHQRRQRRIGHNNNARSADTSADTVSNKRPSRSGRQYASPLAGGARDSGASIVVESVDGTGGGGGNEAQLLRGSSRRRAGDASGGQNESKVSQC
jgi:hypothetical protein